jgi:asparagine synthase (glutamine-hydrolysing)
MCGICGIVDFSRRPVSAPTLERMRDVMVHRGPDAAGLHIEGHAALGHRRLAIIDLSPLGNQPMSNRDGRIWVVFNGEIYNFQDLRQELTGKGYAFRSRSDTEVLVHGYEEWGLALFPKLRGMFALGIWDGRKEELVLARDHFGKKPLFYLVADDAVLFASDIKALLEVTPTTLHVDPVALDAYLFHLSPTQEHCIYREVRKVKPAHYVVFGAKGQREDRYWFPSFQPKVRLKEGDAIEEMDRLLRQAVARRLVADVPLGALLSGGVDSSLVTALVSLLGGPSARTFTVTFSEREFAEAQYADQVARRYKTRHHVLTLSPDVLSILPALVWEYGEPFADSSAVGVYYVTKAAREHVTVALTGDGGDELFGGYASARASYFAQKLARWIPEPLRRRLPAPANGNGLRNPLATLLRYSAREPHIRHDFSLAFSQGHKTRLYTEEFTRALGDHDPWRIFSQYDDAASGLDLMDKNLLRTLMTRLPNDYLIKVDVASMMNSLELRSPFLDLDLSAFSESIPPDLKNRGGRQKYLLKKLAERYLPSEVIYRPKQGFELPVGHWLRNELRPLLAEFVLQGHALERGWFRADYVRQLVDEHLAQRADHTHRLWALLWLEIWFRLFVTQTMRPHDVLTPEGVATSVDGVGRQAERSISALHA